MDEMNLFKTWQTATINNLKDIKSSKEDIMEAIKSQSSSTIGQIKWRMKMKLGWIALFMSLISIWILIDHSNVEILYIQIGLFIMFGSGMISLYPLYKKMNSSIAQGQDTLNTMKTNANLIKKALRIETVWGLIFIPVAAVVGFTLGELYSGSTIASIITDSKGLLILLGISLILVPLANIGAYKANKKAFGEFIEELDQNISKMEAL